MQQSQEYYTYFPITFLENKKISIETQSNTQFHIFCHIRPYDDDTGTSFLSNFFVRKLSMTKSVERLRIISF